MSSPFIRQSNGKLTFSVAVGGFIEDPATGNPIERQAPHIVWATIARPTRESHPLEVTGPDQEYLRLSGKLTEPSQLPKWLKTGSIAKLELFDLATGNSQTGLFTVTSVHQSPFRQVTKAIGASFEGRFRLDRVGEVGHES